MLFGIFWLPQQNFFIFAVACEKKEKTSQYKGIYWHREREQWCLQLKLKGEKSKYGGIFKDELDAAKRLNQLCEEWGIPLQNPEISGIPNQQYQVHVTKKFPLFHGFGRI